MKNFRLQQMEIWQQEYPIISTFKLDINCRKFEREKEFLERGGERGFK